MEVGVRFSTLKPYFTNSHWWHPFDTHTTCGCDVCSVLACSHPNWKFNFSSASGERWESRSLVANGIRTSSWESVVACAFLLNFSVSALVHLHKWNYMRLHLIIIIRCVCVCVCVQVYTFHILSVLLQHILSLKIILNNRFHRNATANVSILCGKKQNFFISRNSSHERDC